MKTSTFAIIAFCSLVLFVAIKGNGSANDFPQSELAGLSGNQWDRVRVCQTARYSVRETLGKSGDPERERAIFPTCNGDDVSIDDESNGLIDGPYGSTVTAHYMVSGVFIDTAGARHRWRVEMEWNDLDKTMISEHAFIDGTERGEDFNHG